MVFIVSSLILYILKIIIAINFKFGINVGVLIVVHLAYYGVGSLI